MKKYILLTLIVMLVVFLFIMTRRISRDKFSDVFTYLEIESPVVHLDETISINCSLNSNHDVTFDIYNDVRSNIYIYNSDVDFNERNRKGNKIEINTNILKSHNFEIKGNIVKINNDYYVDFGENGKVKFYKNRATIKVKTFTATIANLASSDYKSSNSLILILQETKGSNLLNTM